MIDSPQVSVVIPTYNYAQFISQAIDSVLNQTFADYEIIVIDDGSSDRTLEILQAYGRKICYVTQSNQGLAAARNRGIQLARGELIIFLDADDWFLPHMLENAVAVFNAQPELGIVVSDWQIADETRQKTSEVKPWESLSQLDLATWVIWRPLLPSATLFRKEWLNKVGGFDAEIFPAEDIDCVLRMVALGCQSAWSRKLGVCYRRHQQSITQNTLKQAQAFEQLCDRFFEREDLAWKIRQLENQTRFYCLVWSAWRLYITGHDQQMLDYLAKSRQYSTELPAAIIAEWGKYFARDCLNFLGESFDVYQVIDLPGWSELVTSTLNQVMPKVTVVIPVYNSAQYLSEAIASVLSQTYTDYEIIVIDDGSTDNIAEAIAPYLDKIRYVKQSNQGVSAARNRGINLARGELIAFLDADDIFLPHKLADQVKIFNTQPQVGIVNSGFEVIRADGTVVAEVKWWEDIPELNEIAWVLYKPILPSAIMFRRQWLDKVGGFDSRFFAGEDIYLTLNIIAQGCSAAWLTEVTTQYRRHPHSVSLRNPLKQLQNTELMIRTFFDQENLPQSIKDLESASLFSIFTWMASRCYQAKLYSSMAEYLLKSQPYNSHLSWAATTEQWVQIFYNSIEAFGEPFDAYQLSSLPEWSSLIETQMSSVT